MNIHPKLEELYRLNGCGLEEDASKKLEVLKRAMGGIEIGYHFLSEDEAELNVDDAKEFILKNTENFYIERCVYGPLKFV